MRTLPPLTGVWEVVLCQKHRRFWHRDTILYEIGPDGGVRKPAWLDASCIACIHRKWEHKRECGRPVTPVYSVYGKYTGWRECSRDHRVFVGGPDPYGAEDIPYSGPPAHHRLMGGCGK